MTNKFIDNVILKNMMNVNGSFNMGYCRSFKNGKYINIHHYLLNRFDDSDGKLGEIFYRIKHNIEKRNLCKVCGKKTKYDSERWYFKTGHLYRDYCSYKCAAKETKEKNKKTCKEKYNVEYISQYRGFREKVRKTCLNKYGVACNLASKENIQKQHNTCLEKYGDIYPMKNPNIKEKTRNTLMNKYGVKCGYNIPEVKERTKSKESQLHIYEALKRNKSYVKSIPEEKLNDLLVKKYGQKDIYRQFINKEYPWHCDFYIESIDTYIELQGMWTHGKHPFSSTNKDDLHILEVWKRKVKEGSKFYKNAIETWTIQDVKKRQYALSNKLNYIEVYDSNNFSELYKLNIL